MKKLDAATWLNIGLTILCIILSLATAWPESRWEGLGDPYDYLRQAKMSLFDFEFYCPSKTDVHSPRPFTVPLLYKLVGGNPIAIIALQKILNQLAAFAIIAAILLQLKSLSARITAVIAIQFLFSWWNVSGWAVLLISESAATSLFFIWLATWLYYIQKPNNSLLILHIVVLILFSFTRDNWPYLLLPFYGLCFLMAIWRHRDLLKSSSILIGLMLGIFFLQQAAATYGHRYRLPIMHNLIVRVMPNAEWHQWFIEQGMPQSEELKAKFGGLESDDKKMFELYGDTTFQPFFDWVDSKGKSAYMKFLITHPAYSLLVYESPEQRMQLNPYNLWYNGSSVGYTRFLDYVFPIFHWLCLIPVLLLLIWGYLRTRFLVFSQVFFIILVFIFHALIIYNADTYEVARHNYINNSILQFVCIWTIVLLMENWKKLWLQKQLG